MLIKFKVDTIGITESKKQDFFDKLTVIGLGGIGISLLIACTGFCGGNAHTSWKYAGDDEAQQYFNEIYEEVFIKK